MDIKCVVCKEIFKVKPSRKNAKCCSVPCRGVYISRLYTGRKLSDSWKKKIGVANTGKGHGLWKGDNVGYKALHQWVRRSLGIPSKCNTCGTCVNIEWANVSHEYKRDIDDWISLCKRCHRKFDKQHRGNIKHIFAKRLGGYANKL